MGTLLINRTTNQPRSVHSGRGHTSIAHGGWQAKSSVTGDLEKGVSIAYTVVTVQCLPGPLKTGSEQDSTDTPSKWWMATYDGRERNRSRELAV